MKKEQVYNHFKKVWHIYAVSVLVLVTFTTRIRGYDELHQDGSWLFTDISAWYQQRKTIYSAENFPETISFDPLLNYPEGAEEIPYSIVDQIYAIIAFLVGLGSPTEETVAQVIAFTSPFIAVATVISVYLFTTYISRSKIGGVLSATAVTLFPGGFFTFGQVGSINPEFFVVPFIIMAGLYTMKSLHTAQDNIIYLSVLFENISKKQKWRNEILLASLFFGVAYLIWTPIALISLVLFVFSILYSVFYYNHSSVIPVISTTAIINAVLFIFVIVSLPSFGEYTIFYPSMTHVIVTSTSLFGVLATRFALYFVSKKDKKISSYVAYISAVLLAFSSILYFISPSISELFESGESLNVLSWIYLDYGLMFIFSIIGLIFLAYKSYSKEIHSPYSFALIFSVVFVLFGYYEPSYAFLTAPFIGILFGVMFMNTIRVLSIPKQINDMENYHILFLLIICIGVLPVLFIPIESQTVFTQSVEEDDIVDGYNQWDSSLEWLNENAPDNGVNQYGPYSSDDGIESEYGVLSWVDQGYWIPEVSGQSSVLSPLSDDKKETVSEFLFERDEEKAQEHFDREIRYIAIDAQMASPLTETYQEIEQAHPEYDQDDTFEPYFSFASDGSQQLDFVHKEQSYYESLLGQLYFSQGSYMEASSDTVNYEVSEGNRFLDIENPIERWDDHEQATEESIGDTGTSVLGYKQNPPENDVEALNNYRLVHSTERQYTDTEIGQFQTFGLTQETALDLTEVGEGSLGDVKIFEHVEGANITIQNLSPDTEYVLSADIQESINREDSGEFTYEQMIHTGSDETVVESVVPYSTTGYSDVTKPPDTRGVSEYQLVNNDTGDVVAEFDVSEQAVISGDSIEISG